MNHNDELVDLTELARLPMPDLDADRAARIAWSARQDLGRGPSPWRLVEPVLVAALAISYFVWALLTVYSIYL